MCTIKCILNVILLEHNKPSNTIKKLKYVHILLKYSKKGKNLTGKKYFNKGTTKNVLWDGLIDYQVIKKLATLWFLFASF